MSSNNSNYKRKKVSDLIRFIQNSTDAEIGNKRVITPNYSILLGSGASVTSGIRTGNDLIKLWKQEVFDADNEKGDISFDDYFKPQNAPRWYDENMAYSCLFENRYDLQRQRRIFVEKEVAGKTPSIGYAYLVKLIERGFFNTIFTTNFDDLLNEAFYRFSNKRPIVCAHDSSISGITVTSTRPKIIKLHGDYLFDNIKATQQETESLETNMKMKFQEFAKDFGLIVIGYSGGDRSIMDILLDLLRGNDHFKNGIYWCVRKDTKEESFSSELKRLLEKDRVFLVEIEGFDELLSEMNHYLNDGKLPIDDSSLTFKHQRQIIDELTNKINIKTECAYLKRDCEELKLQFENNILSEILKSARGKDSMFKEPKDQNMVKRKRPFQELTNEQTEEIENIKEDVIFKGKEDIILKRLKEKSIFQMKDSRFKLELLEWEADLTKNMDDEIVRKYFDELIRIDPDNDRYYMIAANRSVKFDQKKYYYHKGIERYPNDVYIINSYVDFLLDFCEEYPDLTKCQQILDEIDSYIQQSLNLSRQIRNIAFYHKYRWIQLRYNNETDKRKEKLQHLNNDVMSLSKYHPNSIKIYRLANKDEFSIDKIEEAIDFYLKSDSPKIIEELFIELITIQKSKGNFDQALKSIKRFEKDFEGSDKFKYLKIEVLKSNEYFEDALNILETLPKNSKSINEKISIFGILGRKEEIEAIYNSHPNKEKIVVAYYEATDRYSNLIEYYEKRLESRGYLNKDEMVMYTYSLLKEERYPDIISILKPYNENPNITNGQIKVNYYYALLMSGKEKLESITKKVKKGIIEKQNINTSNHIQLGASCVIEDQKEIISALSKIVAESPVEKYSIRKWPIMQKYLSLAQVSKILAPNQKKL